MIFTHQGAYWVDFMPSDFRLEYPGSLADYREKSQDLSKDLSGAIFKEGISELGPKFFEEIFAPAIEKAEKYNVALYCSEYGVIDLANNDSKINWLRDIHSAFAKYGIGRALWNYKEKDFGFVDDSFASVRDKFIEIL